MNNPGDTDNKISKKESSFSQISSDSETEVKFSFFKNNNSEF